MIRPLGNCYVPAINLPDVSFFNNLNKTKNSNFGFFTDCVLQWSNPQYFLKQITLQLWWQKTSLVEISLVGVGEKEIEMVQYFDKFYISLSVKQYTVLAIINCEPSPP